MRASSQATLTAALWALLHPAAASAEVSYNEDIRPILSDHCFACHGPDEDIRKADLRLGRFDSATAERTTDATGDLGHSITEPPVHIYDLQATILHLMGFDHKRLTHRFQGRYYRLTDVFGNVVPDIMA
jgi:hypothetical protein